MIPAGHPPLQLVIDQVLLIKCCLQKCQFYAIKLAKTSNTKYILGLIWMEILNDDSQCFLE